MLKDKQVEILIAEDSSTQALQLRGMLERQGYHVTHASNGRLALAAAARRIPTLIISDVVMPEMDGYELCRQVKADPLLKEIPVFLVTTLSDPQDVIRGLEANADNFILKPYDERYLLTRVQFVLLNRAVERSERGGMGVEIYFNGQRHFITSDRLQILNLLLSTYDAAIQRNRELERIRQELRLSNATLEERVEQRTAALAESERRFMDLFESAPDAVIIMNQKGMITLVNRAAERIFGWTRNELMGHSVEKLNLWDNIRGQVLVPEGETGVVPRMLGTGRELRAIRKNGDDFPVEITLSPILSAGEVLISAAVRDITERKQLEAQFLQAQKMESVGNLAGGIAHDFNNLITVINGTAELGLISLAPDDPLREEFVIIRDAGISAAAVTRQLFAFSRRHILQPTVVNINRVVADVHTMLRRLISENVQLVIEADASLPNVNVDPGQIEQVVMNLVINGRDAMPRGGKLTIRTQQVTITEDRATPTLRAGQYSVLSISDTGVGMDEATRQRMFEPFFTTKGVGKGTGLGLSTVHGIVKQSGGNIVVQSEIGHGTTIEIYLPSVGGSRLEQTAQSETSSRGTETILLVEDEAEIRQVLKEMLEVSGYSVLVAASGEEAVILFEQEEAAVDLVITDVVMPGMSGRDLEQWLQRTHPSTRVLFMSGYTDDTILHYGVLEKTAKFIAKPFSMHALNRKTREVLDADA